MNKCYGELQRCCFFAIGRSGENLAVTFLVKGKEEEPL